eukprot:4798263-Prymnesium_polylepis.1
MCCRWAGVGMRSLSAAMDASSRYHCMYRDRCCSAPGGSAPARCRRRRSSHTRCTLCGGGCATSMASRWASISACGTVI